METEEDPQTVRRKEPTRAEHTISGYADESITAYVVVCAAAIFPVAKVVTAEAALVSLKTGLGIPSTTSLHCRVIFNSNARRGTPWEAIEPKAINSSIESLCRDLRSIGLRPIAFVTPRLSIFMPGPPGAESEGTSLDEKGQAAPGFQAISLHLTNLHGVGAVKLWIDPDKTKIPWLNSKTQANLTRSGFMELGPGNQPPRSEPLIGGVSKPPLLEIADLYAYVSARAISAKSGWKDSWFQKVYSIINPERHLWGHTNQDPKWQKA